MKIIDCTLRDGGFTNDFNWSKRFYNEYLILSNHLNFEYIEVGYWKQKNKSQNLFYNIDHKTCFEFSKITNKKIAVMSDFHYSSKNVTNYPTQKDSAVSLIRVTSRLEDLDDCIDFLNHLKEYTKLKISLNIFNFSNYSNSNINLLKQKLRKSKFDFVYIADTHGSINLNKSSKNVLNLIFYLKKKFNNRIGFHFHNNIGTAYSNFQFCLLNDFKYFDTTIFGIGRGGGNLKTEQVLLKKNSKLLKFINKHIHDLLIRYNIYEEITGLNSVSNIYAKHAFEKSIDLDLFTNFCKNLSRKQKDNFNRSLLYSL